MADRRSLRAILVGALLTAVTPLWAQTGPVRFRVIDSLGSAIPAATVSLLGADDQPIRTELANDAGESVWTDLPLGDSHLRVTVPGFKSRLLTVTVTKGEEQILDAQLEVGCIECGPEFNPEYMRYSDSLDLTASTPQPRLAKRRWWQIFR
jgi:hypothetical protein